MNSLDNDDWSFFDEFNKPDSPPPDYNPMGYHDPSALDNIPMDDPIASPSRDMGEFSSNLSIPLDFQYGNDPMRLTPNQFESMQPLQPDTYDARVQQNSGMQEQYNSFEQPTLVVNGQNSMDCFGMETLDGPNIYYQSSSPSTSNAMIGGTQQMHVMQQPQHMQPQQQRMHQQQMQPSTSYEPMQQQQQQQQHHQQTPQQPARRPPPSKTANGRKKTQTTMGSVGAVLTQVSRMAQQGGQDGANAQKTTEMRLTVEQMQKLSMVINEKSRLEQEQQNLGIDHSVEIERLSKQFAAIFAENLSNSGSASQVQDTLSQLKQIAAPAPRPAPRRPPTKKQPQRPPNQQNQVHNTIVVTSSSKRLDAPDSPVYQPQMIYATPQQHQQQMPSTSTAQYIEMSSSQGQIQVIQQEMQPPSMNQRTHVYRGQANLNTFTQSNQQMQLGQNVQQQNMQSFPPGTIYVKQTSHGQQQQTIQIDQQHGTILQPAGTVHATLQTNQNTFSQSSQPTVRDMLRYQQNGPPILVAHATTSSQVMMTSTPPQTLSVQTTPTLRQQLGATSKPNFVQRRSVQMPPQQNSQDSPQLVGQMVPGGIVQIMRHSPVPRGSGPIQSQQQPMQMQPPQLQPQLQHQRQHILPPQQHVPRKVIIVNRPTKEQVDHCVNAKTQTRQKRLRDYFELQNTRIQRPDTERPFEDVADVLQRLLPYHVHYEPDLRPEELETFDDNLLRKNIFLDKKMHQLQRKIFGASLKESMKSSEMSERNLLLYLDSEYEKRKLDEDKKKAAENREEFVANSEILREHRLPNGTCQLPDSSKKPITVTNATATAKSAALFHQQYEYHPFDDSARRPPSPYKSPSPIRSPPPVYSSPATSSMSSPIRTPRLRSRQSSMSSAVTSSTTALNTPLPTQQPFGVDSAAATATSSLTKPRIAAPRQPTEKDEARLTNTTKATPTIAAGEVKNEVVKNLIQELKKTKRNAQSAAKAAPILPPPLPIISKSKEIAKTEEVTPKTDSKSQVTNAGLPTKKGFLIRARQDVPLALRSPPAQSVPIRNRLLSTSVEAKAQKSKLASVPVQPDIGDSDGSASPELGLDDDEELLSPSTSMPTKIEEKKEVEKEKVVEEEKTKTTESKSEMKKNIVENGVHQISPFRGKMAPPPLPPSALKKIREKFGTPAEKVAEKVVEDKIVEEQPLKVAPFKLKIKIGPKPEDNKASVEVEEDEEERKRKKKEKKREKKRLKKERKEQKMREKEQKEALEKKDKEINEKKTTEGKEEIFIDPFDKSINASVERVGPCKLRLRIGKRSLPMDDKPAKKRVALPNGEKPKLNKNMHLIEEATGTSQKILFRLFMGTGDSRVMMEAGCGARPGIIKVAEKTAKKQTQSVPTVKEEPKDSPEQQETVNPSFNDTNSNVDLNAPTQGPVDQNAMEINESENMDYGSSGSSFLPLSTAPPPSTSFFGIHSTAKSDSTSHLSTITPPKRMAPLLPWMTEEEMKRKTEERVPKRSQQNQTADHSKTSNGGSGLLEPKIEPPSDEPSSPRASSSMSFLLDDDREQFPFLRSPKEPEPLPVVEFSDDDADNEADHAGMRRAADMFRELSKSQAASNTDPNNIHNLAGNQSTSSMFPWTKRL